MMRRLMNIVLYGRSSYDASMRSPLPAHHPRRFARAFFCARAFTPIPDNKASIVRGGSYAPAFVDVDNYNPRRDGGGTNPARRDGSFTAAGSERRPEEIRIPSGKFVGAL